MAKGRLEAAKVTKENNNCSKEGIKRVCRTIGDQKAPPLICVERDRDTEDGGRKGEITSKPKEIDAIAKRAWKTIHDGMSGCIESAVEEYLNKYRRYIHKAAPAQVKKLTGKRVQEALKKTTESAGGMYGWSPKELSYLSAGTCEVIAVMLSQIEEGPPWPKSAGHARIVFLETKGL